MDQIPIGQQVTKTLKFRQPYPQFSVAPRWDIVNDANVTVLSGSAIISSTIADAWDVSFTIPVNYQSVTSNDTLTLEVYGTDITGTIRSTSVAYTLLDAADDFLPSIVLAEDGEDIQDSLILDFSNVDQTAILVTIQDYLGNILAKNVGVTVDNVLRVANKSDIPDRFTEHEFRGYRYDLTIPGFTFPKLTRAPYQILYRINSTTPKLKTVEVHPCIRLNSRFYDFIASLKLYLDKARLVEIDPTLQWRPDELALAVIEGIDYINAHPTVMSFWTADDIPLPMKSVVTMAAAFRALNTRYLAEGLNNFEFNGLSTSLTVDRRDSLVYKIEEIKGYLDTNLTMQKSNAISTFGIGTPDASVTNAPKQARSIISVQNSPVFNRYGWGIGSYSNLYRSH